MLSRILQEALPSPTRAEWVKKHRRTGLLESERKSVCIMGAGTHEYPLAASEELEYELWGCNALWKTGFMPSGHFRADRWFELHPFFAQSLSDLTNLECAPVDVYVLTEDACMWVPRWILYPLWRIEQFRFRMSFASTFAYQVALAIDCGMRKIRLTGVYMTEGRECVVERANLLYWIGIAEGLGIEVELVQCNVNLIQHPYLYGYHYTSEKQSVEEACRNVLNSIARDGWRGSR